MDPTVAASQANICKKIVKIAEEVQAREDLLKKKHQEELSKQQEAFDLKLQKQKEESDKAIQILEDKIVVLLEQVSSYESCLNEQKTTGENSGKSIQSVLEKYHAPQNEQCAMDSALEKTSAHVGQSSKPVGIENEAGAGTSTSATHTLLEVAATGSADESCNGNTDKESSSNDQRMMGTRGKKRGIPPSTAYVHVHGEDGERKPGNYCFCGKKCQTKLILMNHIKSKNASTPPLILD